MWRLVAVVYLNSHSSSLSEYTGCVSLLDLLATPSPTPCTRSRCRCTSDWLKSLALFGGSATYLSITCESNQGYHRLNHVDVARLSFIIFVRRFAMDMALTGIRARAQFSSTAPEMACETEPPQTPAINKSHLHFPHPTAV